MPAIIALDNIIKSQAGHVLFESLPGQETSLILWDFLVDTLGQFDNLTNDQIAESAPVTKDENEQRPTMRHIKRHHNYYKVIYDILDHK